MKMIPHTKPTLGSKERAAVDSVLRSGHIAGGPAVKQFEKALARKAGMRYGAAVSSGTAALYCALRVLGVGKGDRVIIPDFVCTALLNAVTMAGAMPVLADIGPSGAAMTAETVAPGLTSKVKAIIVPHLFGKVEDLTPFRRFGIPIIEDCAQTLGVSVNGKRAGSMGDISIFSFYATKLLCAGEGGMVCANNSRIIDAIKDFRDYDERSVYRERFNFKMTDLHAAVGLAQLGQLSTFVRKRRRIAAYYNKHIADKKKLVFRHSRNNVYFRYVIESAGSATRAVAVLKKAGITARRPIFRLLSSYLGKQGLPNSRALFTRAVSLPVFPDMTLDQAKRVVKAVNSLQGHGV